MSFKSEARRLAPASIPQWVSAATRPRRSTSVRPHGTASRAFVRRKINDPQRVPTRKAGGKVEATPRCAAWTARRARPVAASRRQSIPTRPKIAS